MASPSAPYRLSGAAPRPTPRRLAAWGLAAWVLVMAPAVTAQQATPCASLLETAEERYIQLEFAEAESLVQACLAQPDLSDAEALRAYRQLTLIFLQRDDLPAAKGTVVALLERSFEYAPDPTRDPPSYVSLVTSVKERMQSDRSEEPAADIQIVRVGDEPPEEPAPTVGLPPERQRSGLTRWLLIGGGAVVAGAVAVMLTSGDAADTPPASDPFPLPPAFPR